VDAAGDAFFTGTLFYPPDGQSDLTFGMLPAGGTATNFIEQLQTPGSAGLGIAVDAAGTNAYIAGTAVDPGTGLNQALLARVDLTNGLTYRTAGTAAGNWAATAVAVNANGVYFALNTPTVAAILSTDSTLVNVTHEFDFTDRTATVAGIGLDSAGNVFVTGQSTNPTTHNPTAQLTKLDSNLRLVRFVRLGGTGTDAGLALAVKSTGSVVVAGTTTSADFPATDGTTLNGTSDAFLMSYTF
jgi:hypothetical protein